jgi:hypothetical protein
MDRGWCVPAFSCSQVYNQSGVARFSYISIQVSSPMLYLAAIMLAFFLSVVLVTKKKKSTGDYILFAWLVTIGLHLLFFYLFNTQQYITRPWLIVPGFVLPLAHSPFLYLYTIHQLSAKRFKPVQLLHFLPLLLSALLCTSCPCCCRHSCSPGFT